MGIRAPQENVWCKVCMISKIGLRAYYSDYKIDMPHTMRIP